MSTHTGLQKTLPDLVRAAFAAFRTGDKAAMEELLHQDFTFTSPYDDHIGKAAYFERCWPHRGQIKAHDIQRIFEKENEALVIYEGIKQDGHVFRNAELFIFAGKKANITIKSIEVYFGREIK